MSTRRHRLAAFAAGALGVLAAACSAATLDGRAAAVDDLFPGANYGENAAPSGDEFGATQGGLQGLTFARELVAAGRVPPAEAFVAEAMFSEHDLPVDGEACDEPLCLRATSGVAPNNDGALAGWIQVGLSSSIDPATFVRPSITLVVAVDVSGSMGWSYQSPSTEYPTPGGVARALLRAITAELGASDRFALVTFDDVTTQALPLIAGSNDLSIQGAIDALTDGGSTNLEAGLTAAFDLARTGLDGTTDEVRVVLLSDAQPNVGATTPSAFQTLVRAAASDGVSLTVFGLGVGLDAALLGEIVTVRGGNAYTLSDYDDVTALMADAWPYFVSPVAYDLHLALTPPATMSIAATYGFPDDGTASVGFDVATVFLSRRRGALLIELAPSTTPIAAFAATGTLSYTAPDGSTHEQVLAPSYDGSALDASGRYFAQLGVGKTVALALLVEGMATAAHEYSASHTEAVATLTAALDRFVSDVTALGTSDLQIEVTFAQQLLSLMQSGAPQGDLYGR
ncbi:MAG: VWA domain-containing protein [Myxococcota bacterium]